MLAPLGPVYQAGTLSGNPVTMAAGHATLGLLDDAAYARLEAAGEHLAAGLRDALRRAGIVGCVQQRRVDVHVLSASKPRANLV